ncbi:hypothetical protein JMJ77_0001868 [Colletotrichum scovillei]|uniref:Uncharacterized protein n=1 Tax=Colletotrichum scovillei TaxID=1209932 RepID=A0A9P7UD44_9PEZI|nr:hypothetical protein JMJ77_0001868 [Colletotrichum scovillei]KAG7070279.1 hypothetical protein JMJ76_0001534 [Colletotrichum scovillei]KAG7078529.1 hypothetical protein JMJ78_0002199 [Colletotrichum scovillei]
MQLKSLFALALAAAVTAAAATPGGTESTPLDKRAPTKAECCCCYGGPSVGCAADLNCAGYTPSIGVCLDTRCPFK